MKIYRFLIVYILVQSIFFSSVTNASVSIGGWTISETIRQGASSVIKASRNAVINGANVLKTSTATIKPTASQVAKILRGGAAGYALSIAVQQLLGSVDWVLDAENNRIIYKEGIGSYYHPWVGSYDNLEQAKTALCNEVAKRNSKKCTGTGAHRMISPSVLSFDYCLDNVCNMSSTLDVKSTGTRDKYLPLDVVAQRVISNADAGDSSAQAATAAAADDALQNDSSVRANAQQQLEANAKTDTNENADADSRPKDPDNPDKGMDIKITFPVFCSWAPVVCEAAQVAINFPNIMQSWYDSATQSIVDAWTYTKDQYKTVFDSFDNAWTWAKDQYKAVTASFTDAWTWTKDQYKAVTASFTDAWTWTKEQYQAVTASFTDAWTWTKEQYQAVTASFTDAWTWVGEQFQAVTASFTDAWTWTKEQYQAVTASFTDAWTWTKEQYQAVTASFTDAWTWTKEQYLAVTTAITDSWTWVEDQYKEVKDSITESWTWVKDEYNIITKNVTDFFKNEPSNDTELNIEDPVLPDVDTQLNFNGQCPPDRVAHIPFVLRTIEMKFSYQPICRVVSDAKPVLIFVGFFIAALIVGGIKQ